MEINIFSLKKHVKYITCGSFIQRFNRYLESTYYVPDLSQKFIREGSTPCLCSAYILLVRVAVVVGGMAGFGDLLLVGDTEVPTGLSPAGRER